MRGGWGMVWAVWGLAGPMVAQQIDLAKAYDAGVGALEAGAYEEGLKITQRVIEETGAGGLSRFGPSFGHFYYLQGMLLIGKKDYRGAMEPLRVAAEDYGNEKREAGQPLNVFVNHARMQWGMCEQALGNHGEAAKHFEAVLAADKGAEPKINRFALELNLARCYLKTGREGEGREMLTRLLGGGQLSPEAVQDAFTVLAAEADGELDVMGLVREHAGALQESEESRAVMNPRYAGLAARALNGGDYAQALVWYNLMTPPGRELGELEEELGRLEGQRAQAEQQGRRELLEKIEQTAGEKRKAREEIRQRHLTALLGMAAAHYQMGSLTAAYALYREILAQFPKVEQRGEVLHNAVLCATSLERWEDAAVLGKQFAAEYPAHPLQGNVSRVLAEVVFTRGDYATALEMGMKARAGVASGSPERAALDFVVAASHVQLNRWEEAEGELLGYLKSYPQHPNAGDARYFLGLMKTKQAKWAEARRWLMEYVDEYREGASRPNALYLLSLACLVEEQPLQALIRVNQLLGDHRTAPQTAPAHNVKGDAQLALGESYETVQASYQRARAAAQLFGKEYEDAGAYALKQLVALATEGGRWEEAAGFYRELLGTAPESRWRTDATISAARALASSGKEEEALRLLEELVAYKAGKKGGEGLERAVRTYCEYLAGAFPAEERMARLSGFEAAKGNVALKAMLLVGQIDALPVRPGEPAGSGQTGELFKELEELFGRSGGEMSGYALVRLARWRSGGKKDPGAALRVYEEVLRRRDKGEALGMALAESAALLYEADPAGNAGAAEERFREALAVSDAAEVREVAVLGLGRLATAAKQWKEGESRWLEYLEERSWARARPEVNFGYARCLDGQGRTEEALKVYVSVYANFPGELDLSTESYLRASEILWTSGRQVDALKVLQDMLRRMEQEKHPNVTKAEARFFQWRDQFASQPRR